MERYFDAFPRCANWGTSTRAAGARWKRTCPPSAFLRTIPYDFEGRSDCEIAPSAVRRVDEIRGLLSQSSRNSYDSAESLRAALSKFLDEYIDWSERMRVPAPPALHGPRGAQDVALIHALRRHPTEAWVVHLLLGDQWSGALDVARYAARAVGAQFKVVPPDIDCSALEERELVVALLAEIGRRLPAAELSLQELNARLLVTLAERRPALVILVDPMPATVARLTLARTSHQVAARRG